MAHAIRGRVVVLIVSVLLLTTPTVGGVPAGQQSVAQQSVSQTAAAEGTLSLNETSIDTASGNSFLLAVNYDATTGSDDTTVGGVQFTLEYDPTYLSAKSISNGSYLKDNDSTLLTPERSIDDTAGTVSYAAATTTNGTTGQGTVAYVRFETTSDAPNATVGAQSLTFSGVKVSDPETNSIPTETVSADVNVNVRPQPDIAFSPASPEVNETVSLNASGSTDSDGDVTAYEWDTNGDESFDGTGETVQTSYSSSGMYNVSVRVTDDDGATNTTMRTLNVGKKSVNLEITANQTSVEAGGTIRFNTSRQDSGNRVAATVTADGIGSASTGSDGTITVTFADAGTVEVTASKTDTETTAFNNDSIQIDVQGNSAPTASFDYEPTLPATNESVTFDASDSFDSDGQITTYKWDINGNGSFEETGVRLNYTFTETQNTTVRLATEDDSGAKSTTEQAVRVVDNSAGLELEPADTELGLKQTRKVDIVLTHAEDGVSSYDITLNVSNRTVAEITAVTATVNSSDATTTTSVSSDGSTGQLNVGIAGESYQNATGDIVVGTATIKGKTTGSTGLTPTTEAIGTGFGKDYTVASLDGSQVRVAGPPTVGDFDSPPTDPDGDGKYEDINGGGSFNVVDVFALYDNQNDPAITQNGDAFDFNDGGTFNVVDVFALYQEAQ